MPWEVVVQLGIAGGFMVAAVGAGIALRVMFDAWRKGDLVSKPFHEAMVKQLTEANAALRADLAESAKTNSRLADAVQRLGDLLQEHDTTVRERLAGLGTGVQTGHTRGSQGGG